MPPAKKKAAKVAPQPVHASLAHLPPCPECGFRAGAPVMSEGISNEENADCWYETCLNNRPPRYSTCSYFAWRNDIPDGKPANSEARSCPGLLCTSRADAGKNRKTANLDCSFGACKSCCRDIQTNVSPPRWCKVRDHSTGLVRPPMPPTNVADASSEDDVEASNTDQDDLQEPVGRGRGRRPARAQRQGRGRGITTTQRRDGHATGERAGRGQVAPPQRTGSAVARGASRRRNTQVDPLGLVDPDLYADPDEVAPALDVSRPSVALSIGPYYQAALTASEQQQRLQAELADTEARHERARAKRHETSLRWWNENDELPQSLVVPVPKWPEFHPPDIPLLADEFLSTNDRFQYWESKDGVWFTGSKGTAPRDLRKLTKDDLCYRSWDVRRGQGMPGAQVKRSTPDDYLASESSLGAMAYLLTPHTHTRRSSPAPTTPPGSESSAASWIDETPTRPPSRSDPSDADTITRPSRPSQPLDIQPPLPALFPVQGSDTQPQGPLPALFPSEYASLASATAGPSSLPLDLSSAPRGQHVWPWRYVCDMAAGFDAMRLVQDQNPGMSKGDIFTQVFRHAYKTSTYSEQIRAWQAAGRTHGERERWIAFGRSEDGEWSKFMKIWRGKR